MIVHGFCSNLCLYLGLYLNGKQITKFQVNQNITENVLILVFVCVYFNDNDAKLAGLIGDCWLNCFAQEIAAQESESFMESLNVGSLFTNIPLEETIDICFNTVFENTERYYKK